LIAYNILSTHFSARVFISYYLQSNPLSTAYILVNCAIGSEESIIKKVAKLIKVKEVRGTYWIHDIVKVKSDSMQSLKNAITNKLEK
jgi:hypothetical protein